MASSGKSSGTSRNSKLGNPKKETPKKYDTHDDPRKQKSAGKYPNYWSYKTRSGHTMIFDDSEGEESITLQHRSGSALQFLPTGEVQMTTHNGKYEIVFGENRMTVTGAHDLTVKGDGSMLVYGNYNKTVHGDVNMTVSGDFNVTAKNHNILAREDHHVIAQNIVNKVDQGINMVAGGDIAQAAGNQMALVGKKAFSAGGKQTSLHAGSGGLDIKSHGKMNVDVKEDHVVKNQAIYSIMTEQDYIAETQGKKSEKVTGTVTIESGSKSEKVIGSVDRQISGSLKDTVLANRDIKTTGIHSSDASVKKYQSGTSVPASPTTPDQVKTPFEPKFNSSSVKAPASQVKPFGSSIGGRLL